MAAASGNLTFLCALEIFSVQIGSSNCAPSAICCRSTPLATEAQPRVERARVGSLRGQAWRNSGSRAEERRDFSGFLA